MAKPACSLQGTREIYLSRDERTACIITHSYTDQKRPRYTVTRFKVSPEINLLECSISEGTLVGQDLPLPDARATAYRPMYRDGKILSDTEILAGFRRRTPWTSGPNLESVRST